MNFGSKQLENVRGESTYFEFEPFVPRPAGCLDDCAFKLPLSNYHSFARTPANFAIFTRFSSFFLGFSIKKLKYHCVIVQYHSKLVHFRPKL